jgi:NAD(P)-dependent dehydrogenase (short-subunit alcohol dehydrogenase family)
MTVYSGMRYAAEHMRGGGVIINNASFAGTVMPVPIAIAYGGTKAAVVSMTRAASLELADRGIEVVAISPWIADTPWLTGLPVASGRRTPPSPATRYINRKDKPWPRPVPRPRGPSRSPRLPCS